MKITKYVGHTCMKCRMLEKLLTNMELPCDIDNIYADDEDVEVMMEKGIMTLPTLIIENGNKKVTLTGTITAKQIKDALEEVQ